MSTEYIRYPNNTGGGGGGVTSLNTLTGAVTLLAGANITITPGINTLTIASSGGSAVPSLPFNSIQYNNAGAFGGSSNLTYDGTDCIFTTTGNFIVRDAALRPFLDISLGGTTTLGGAFNDTYVQTNSGSAGLILSSANGILSTINDASQFKVQDASTKLFLQLSPSFGIYQIGDIGGLTGAGVISITGSTVSFGASTYDYSFPTDSGVAGQVLTTDGINTLTWQNAGLTSGTAPFQWWNWNNNTSTQSWQQLWAYTDSSGAVDNSLFGHNAGGLTELVPSGIGTLNTMVGAQAGSTLGSGSANLFAGYAAGFGRTNTTDRCVILGPQTLSHNGAAIADSVFIGHGVGASGGSNVIIGSGVAPSAQDGIFGNLNVIIGAFAAPNIVANTENVIIGANAGNSLATGSGGAGNMFLGNNAGNGVGTNPQNCVAIGINTTFDTVGVANSVILGNGSHCTDSAQFVVGGPNSSINQMYLGQGVQTSVPDASVTINATSTENGFTDTPGSSLIISGGQNTGNATGGGVEVWASNISVTSGNAQRGTSQVATFDDTGISVNKTISKYNGNTTVANGVASIVGEINFLGVSTPQSATTVFTPTSDGMYEIGVYGECTSPAISGDVNVAIDWTDTITARTNTPIGLDVSGTNFTAGTPTVIYATAGNPISVETVFSSVVGIPTYNMYFICKRLS